MFDALYYDNYYPSISPDKLYRTVFKAFYLSFHKIMFQVRVTLRWTLTPVWDELGKNNDIVHN